MQQPTSGSGFNRGRGVRFRLSGVVVPAIGSVVSIVAWTHWRPPLHVPGLQDQTKVTTALGPLGNGLARAHGLGTPHGAIGLVSAIACLGGIIGLFLPGRLRWLAAAVIAVSTVAITVNGLTAFLSASHLHQQWSSLTHAVGTGGTNSSLDSVSSAIVKNALAPSAAATAAGAVSFAGGLNTVRTALRSLRLGGRPGSLGFPGM